ncbi:hypothetical protein [Actinomyces provencensis]|uniref:hypothetical protein n=1 Tax=Actinomyces provencensis TaxID=1720198 RepID=UPI0012B5F9A7|nr:hypothetical protein [Actinomyces provencensis]
MTPGAPLPVPDSSALASQLQAVDARLEGFEELPLDLQVRTLAAVEADLRSALETARS